MPLDKHQIPVRFTGGLDTKTAEQLAVPGSFLRLENCVRRKTGRIEKRHGFDNLGQSVVSSDTPISSGKRLDTFNNDVLLLDTDRLYSYVQSTDKWVDRGALASVLVDAEPLIRNSYKQALPDVAYLAGFTATVYMDSRAATTARYAIYDDATGASIVYDAVISADADQPRIVAVNGNTFVIGYRKVSTSSLGLALISTADPSTLTSLTAVETGAFDDGPWHLVAYDSFALAAFNTGSGANTRLVPIDHSGDVGNGLNGMPVPLEIAQPCPNGVSIAVDETNQLFYLALADASNVYAAVVPYTMIDSYLSAGQALSNISNVTIATKSDGTAKLFVESGAPATVAERKTQLIYTGAVTYTAATTTTALAALAEFKRSVGLASQAWLVDGAYYVTAAHDSGLQASYFVIKDDGLIVAKAAPGLGGGLSQDTDDALQPGLSSVCFDSQSRYIVAGRQKNQLRADADGTVLAASVGIQKLAFTFGGESFESVTLGDNFMIAGGIMLAYDGISATELNFHLYPEDVTASTAAGSLTSGTYYYAAVYEWQDAKGQIHRSAPSVITSVSSATGATVVVPTLRLTLKTGTRADVKIVLYSGDTDDDTVMYRVADVTNDPTADTYTFTDTSRAADFTAGEVLYTTGGIVDSVAPPASKVLVNHKNRLFIGGLEDGLTVAYSREHVYGEGVNFSDFFTFRVDPRGGAVTALASLDDKLVIFKKDAIFAMAGDGPLDTGAQNDYTQPQLIVSDLGCDTPRSIVLTPAGLMFKSDKGLYLLDRSLGTRYVGDRVENYNTQTITSAVVLEDTNEVRFTTAASDCLVYNYLFDQWSTFTNYQSVSACHGLSSYLHMTSTGLVGKENTSSYNDAGSRYSMAIETSWLSFADLQGCQRIYEIMGLGDYISNHITRIKMAYDFEDAYNETVYFNVDTDLDLTYYGDDATFGSSSVFGGSGASIYQWSLKPRRQKCQSIKLLIEDIDTLSTNGDGSFNFVALTFTAGLKVAGPKLRSEQNIGSRI